MKNGYFGLMCWIFGLVAVAALAWGAYILIGGEFDFGLGSGENETEVSTQTDQGSEEAFYIEGYDQFVATF